MRLMSFIQGKTIHGLGDYSAEQWSTLLEGFWARASFTDDWKQ